MSRGAGFFFAREIPVFLMYPSADQLYSNLITVPFTLW